MKLLPEIKWLSKIKFALLLTVSLWGNALYAESEAASSLIKHLSQISSLEAVFSQVLTDRDGRVLQQSEGEIKMQKPGKFFWQVAPPYEQLIVSNGNKLWVYDADLEQATIHSKSDLKNTPAEILSGDFSSITSAYDTRELAVKSKNKVRRFELHPKAGGDFVAMAFEFKKDKLSSFSIQDKLGQTTHVDFKKQRLNKAINVSIFNFIPPEGTDVIVNE